MPTPRKYVRFTKANLASPSALLVLRSGSVYEVDSETPTSYRLKNALTGHRIAADGVEYTRLIPKKLWFDELTEPPSEEEVAGCHDTPKHTPSDPYSLRSVLPPLERIWEATNDLDVYTGRSRVFYERNMLGVDRDHVVEVQTASVAMVEVFPTSGKELNDDAVPVVKVTREFLNALPNLNNTDASLNRWFKGVAVSEFNRRYSSGQLMRREVDGLASILRDKMRVASEKDADWVSNSVVFHGRGPVIAATGKFSAIVAVSDEVSQPLTYAPRFARSIEKEMGGRLNLLVEELEERDGQKGFLDYAEKLREVGRKMDI